MTTPRPLTLLELAHRAGQAAWVEARCFEIVGTWAASTPEPGVVGPLVALSHRHARRAEQWATRVPEHTIVDAAEVTVAPTPDVAALLTRIGSLPGTAERLAALAHLVLPALGDAYAAHRARTSPVCDGATTRVLRLAGADVDEERHAVEVLLGAVGAPDAQAVEGVARALDAAGGILSRLP